MHLTHHLNSHSSVSGKLTFLVLIEDQDLFCIEYNDDDETPMHRIRMVNLTPPFGSFYYSIMGSINGLVYLYGGYKYGALICSPVTREYVQLPNVKYTYFSTGFGYLPLTNEYKVVELYRDVGFIEVSVYTLGSGKGWRNVGRLDSKSCNDYDAHGVFVNGALHWVGRGGIRVLAFDLAKEKFKYLSPPQLPLDGLFGDYNIGALHGVLYCSVRGYYDINDIWILKEQVEHEPLGWSKEFTLPRKKPLAFTKSGDVLCFNYSSLDIYDVIATTSKKLVDFSAFSQILPHKNTLVSLKELGEEDIKILDSAEHKKFPVNQHAI